MKNILVTGAAGFIGSHLVKYHLQKGCQVWAIDNLSAVGFDNLAAVLSHKNLRFTQADICEYKELDAAVAWSDRIYHMAAVVGQQNVIDHPVNTLSVNINSCEKILEAMAKTQKDTRLLIASSSGVYWHSPIGHDGMYREEQDMVLPSGRFQQESYCISKMVNEIMALSYAYEKNIHCTIARIFNTIGVNQTGKYGMVVPRFIQQALNGQPITIFGDGQQTRSFCNVHDTVEAIDMALENPQSKGLILNVGNQEECSILDLAKLVLAKTKSSSQIQYISYLDAYGMDFIDAEKRRPCIDKLISLTGFKPKWSLSQTIDEIIEDLKTAKGKSL